MEKQRKRLTRRQLNAAAIGLTTAVVPYHSAGADSSESRLVAAVQMHARMGDVDGNLRNAAKWVKKATAKGAQVVVLPEFFTSGLGYHPSMMHAHRPIDGEPAQMIKQLSKELKIWLGGSFLAESGGHVYNTFLLAVPDGRVFTHDKDFPTADMEQLLYAAGEDDKFVKLLRNPIRREVVPGRKGNIPSGVFDLGDVRIGNAMCWELVRKETDRRLLAGKTDLILAGSGWWHFSDPKEAAEQLGRTETHWKNERERGRVELVESPKRIAKMVGAPVAHANLVGVNRSFRFPIGVGTFGIGFQGESQIVASDGSVIDKRSEVEGEGIVLGEVVIGHREPLLEIGKGFWHIRKNDPASINWWYKGYGRDYYLTATQPQRQLYAESR